MDVSRLRVRVTPRGGRDSVDGFDADGVLRVRVRAAPADGEANAAVVRLLARALGLATGRVTLVSGATSRVKLLEIQLDEAELRERLRGAGE